MKQRNYDGYIESIKNWLKSNKSELHEGLLVQPSGAEIRELCLKLHRNGLAPTDEAILKAYFKTADDGDLKKDISKYDTEKFRAVINFINGTSQHTVKINANLIATLIGFPERPFSKFLAGVPGNTSTAPFETLGRRSEPNTSRKKNVTNNKILLWVLAFALMGIIIIFVRYISTPTEECMAWENNHYTKISCRDTTFERTLIEPFNRKQMQLKKISVSKKTVFFNNGQPKVWYLKHNNSYEFFDGPGHHPVFKEKELNPVTRYVVMKVMSGDIHADEDIPKISQQ